MLAIQRVADRMKDPRVSFMVNRCCELLHLLALQFKCSMSATRLAPERMRAAPYEILQACSTHAHACFAHFVPPPYVQAMDGYKPHMALASGMGPQRALTKLLQDMPELSDRIEWAKEARVNAILGACPRSHDSVKSGVKAYVDFVSCTFGGTVEPFPPTVETLLAWSHVFRCHDTYQNYVSHVKTACLLAGVCHAACNDTCTRRAKIAISKRGGFAKRMRLFIRRPLLVRILDFAKECAALRMSGQSVLSATVRDSRRPKELAMLFLAAYIFLLRLPSEALPMARGYSGDGHGEQSGSFMLDGCVYLRLARRKNKPSGSLIKRSCWCSMSPKTCPVHVLWPFVSQFKAGERPFDMFTPKVALLGIRWFLHKLNVHNAALYRTHDLRRGHTLDLQCAGTEKDQIKSAGGWRSDTGYMSYLDLELLEHDAVMREAQLDLSSSEGGSSTEDEDE